MLLAQGRCLTSACSGGRLQRIVAGECNRGYAGVVWLAGVRPAAEARVVRQPGWLPEGVRTSSTQVQGPSRGWRRWAAVAAALAATGCGTWQGRPEVLARSLGPRDQVRIWARGSGYQVHGVQVRGDSVVGVPFIRPPTCDSCALRFARSEVDSVQVRAFDWRRSVVAAILAAPLVYGLYQWGGMSRQ